MLEIDTEVDENVTPQSATVHPADEAKPEVETLHERDQPRSWSKAEAPSSMLPVLVTDDVSQAPMSWLKASLMRNISLMLVTDAVFQAPMSWSKAEALENMELVAATDDVSQPPMFPLKR